MQWPRQSIYEQNKGDLTMTKINIQLTTIPTDALIEELLTRDDQHLIHRLGDGQISFDLNALKQWLENHP